MTGTHTETIPLVDETELTVTLGEPEGAVRGGVVVLHESRGITTRTEAIVEGLAGEGWLVVAPHLYHRDGGESHDDATDEDEVVDAASRRVSGESVLRNWTPPFGVSANGASAPTGWRCSASTSGRPPRSSSPPSAPWAR